jgi:hypothetical protein
MKFLTLLIAAIVAVTALVIVRTRLLAIHTFVIYGLWTLVQQVMKNSPFFVPEPSWITVGAISLAAWLFVRGK